MKRMSFSEITGGVLIAYGLLVMIGGCFTVPYLNSLINQYPHIACHSVLCFVLSGFALFLPAYLPSLKNRIQVMFGMSILVVALINVLHLNSDHMSLNVSAGFIMTGLTIIAFAYAAIRVVAIFIQISVLLVVMLGLSVLLGYMLNIEVLYSWHQYNNMAILSAVGFLILALAIGSEWSKHPAYLNLYKGRDDKKIIILSAMILVCIALAAGIAGFATSAKRNEALLHTFMLDAIKHKINTFEATLTRPIEDMKTTVNDDQLKKILMAENADQPGAHANELAKLLFTESFSAIQVKDKHGKLVYSEGQFTQQPVARFPLRLPYLAYLEWKDGFSLTMESNVYSGNQLIGQVVAEWPLETITELTADEALFVCVLNKENELACLPRKAKRLDERIFSSREDQAKLTSLAVMGKTGFFTGDHADNGMTLSAYETRSDMGLVFVFKANTEKLYQPIREHLQLIVPMIMAIIGFGILLLYWQVLPLLRRVVDSEERIQESEARFRLSFNSAASGMALIGLDGMWQKVNPMMSRIIGYTEEEFLSCNYRTMVATEDLPACEENFKALLEDKKISFQMDVRFICRVNRVIWVLLSVSLVRDGLGNPLYYIAQLQDVTDKKKTEQALSYQAYYDGLTGLVNRNHLEENLAKAISSAVRHQNNFAVFFMDIDHFKKINDSLGHDVGDELLKVVADRLKNSIRVTDIAARLGGDEFLLILNGINSPETAATFAEKLINLIMQPIKIHQHELFVSMSIGISFYPDDGMDYQALIKSADLALYSAKQKGRNNYQFCTPEMNAEIKGRASFKNALQEALEAREFHLDFQPKIEMATQKTIAIETLLRWHNQTYGEVAPNKIIPLAEESGIIIPLSEWILLSACQQTKRWQQAMASTLMVTVNVANKQFKSALFINSVSRALTISGLAPSYLELEISEGLIMQDPEYSLRMIRALHDMGVQVSIDNFGTGYSSFVYLHQFAVDKVKIDRSLIQQIGVNQSRASIISTMIELAKNLRMRVAAEGVETKAQYDFLLAHGCDEAQGYYISYPLSVEKMTAYLEGVREKV